MQFTKKEISLLNSYGFVEGKFDNRTKFSYFLNDEQDVVFVTTVYDTKGNCIGHVVNTTSQNAVLASTFVADVFKTKNVFVYLTCLKWGKRTPESLVEKYLWKADIDILGPKYINWQVWEDAKVFDIY